MGYWQFFDKDSYTSIHCGGFPRGTDREVARLYADQKQPGLVIPAAGGGISVGTFASTAAGSGYKLRSGYTSASRFYADDGGAALTAGAYRSLVARTLLTAACGAADISAYGAQAQLKIVSDQSLAQGICGGLWGYVELSAAGKVARGAALVAHIDVPTGGVVSTHLSGLLIKSNDLSGTHTGVVAAVAVLNPLAGTFDQFALLEDATGCTTGTTGATALTCLKVKVGSTQGYVQVFSGVS